jgi:TRAP-type transport system small permease protein
LTDPQRPGGRAGAPSRRGRRLQAAADAIGVAFFAALFMTFVVQVTARFVFDRPLPWSDELAVVLYIAVVLWGAALLVPWHGHVAMDLLYQMAPRPVRRGMVFVGAAATAGLAATAWPASWDYVRFMGREGTPVLGWSLMAVYSPFLLLLAAIVVRGTLAAIGAWRDRLPEDVAFGQVAAPRSE